MPKYVSYEDAKNVPDSERFLGNQETVGDSKMAEFIPKMDTPDTTVGEFAKSISQFVTGWYTGGRILKPIKATTKGGKIAKSLARGAVADFQAFGQETGRFADIINTHAPALQNPIFDYLGSEGKDEGFYEARLKNAIEGVFLGGVMEGVFKGLNSDTVLNTVKWLKTKKKMIGGEKVDANKMKEIEEGLIRNVEEEVVGKGNYHSSTKKLKKQIVKEAGDEKTAQIVTKLTDITSA